MESIADSFVSTKSSDSIRLYDALEPKGFEIDVDPDPSQIPVFSSVVIDVEHDEEGNFVCCGILGVSTHVVRVYFDLDALRRISFSEVGIIAHNGHSDLSLLREWGIDVKDSQLVHDTQLCAHILQPDLHEYGLKYLGKRYLGIEYPSYDDIVGKRTKKQAKERVTLDKQPKELVARYNAWDCWSTLKLYEYQQRLITERDRKYFQVIEKPCASIFRDMETRGISVDLVYLRQLAEEFRPKLDLLESELQTELGGINLNAPKQVLSAFNSLGIHPVYHRKSSLDKRGTLYTAYSEHPIVDRYRRWNELATLQDTFVRPYLERGQAYIHPFFNQCGTRTGRLSCSNPNLLQIPKKTENGRLVRQMFCARSGFVLGDLDFGQIEPRVLAHLSQDQNMLQMFNDGVDFHEFTASRLSISRDNAKVLNLSVGYRATWRSVAQQLGCTQQEAQQEIEAWWALFPGLRRWEDRLIYEAKKSGYVTTLFGFRIPIDSLNDPDMYHREHMERVAINNITQGSAAEIMKKSMLSITNNINKLSSMFGILVQVYDELLVETDRKEDVQMCQQLMQDCVTLSVPLVVDYGIGDNWDAAKPE